MKKKSKKGGIPQPDNRVKFKRKESALATAMANTRAGSTLAAVLREPTGPRSTEQPEAPAAPAVRAPYTALDSTKPWLEFDLRGQARSWAQQVTVNTDDTLVPMGPVEVQFHLSAYVRSRVHV